MKNPNKSKLNVGTSTNKLCFDASPTIFHHSDYELLLSDIYDDISKTSFWEKLRNVAFAILGFSASQIYEWCINDYLPNVNIQEIDMITPKTTIPVSLFLGSSAFLLLFYLFKHDGEGRKKFIAKYKDTDRAFKETIASEAYVLDSSAQLDQNQAS